MYACFDCLFNKDDGSEKPSGVSYAQRDGGFPVIFAVEQADGVFAFNHDLRNRVVVDAGGHALASAPFVFQVSAVHAQHRVVVVVAGEEIELLFRLAKARRKAEKVVSGLDAGGNGVGGHFLLFGRP